MADELTVRIEKLVYGGNGLARVEGQTVFVPFSAPGDLARVRVVERKKGFLRAELLQVLEPGPGRRRAPCPYYGPCGGCQLQHLTYGAQLEAKAGFVREALNRIGKIDWPNEVPVAAAPERELGYRLRVTAHVAGPPGRRAFGYFAAQSHEVVDIAACPLLVPELNDAWAAARAAAEELATARRPGRRGPVANVVDVELAAGDGTASVAPPVAGLRSDAVSIDVLGATYRFGPESFFQVNRAMLPELVARATMGDGGSLAVDLYSGVGLFTVPLARAFGRVVAVEVDGASADYAAANARANGVSNAELVTAPVERWLRRPSVRPGDVDLALLDPPRGGLGPAAAGDLARLGPRRIAYVSCDPTTLARDLRVLLDAGYALESVEALDLFPQTFHVESIARLARA
jgi:23S rRNA (uracil1939-C5)-methyltransferase